MLSCVGLGVDAIADRLIVSAMVEFRPLFSV